MSSAELVSVFHCLFGLILQLLKYQKISNLIQKKCFLQSACSLEKIDCARVFVK